MTPRVERFPLWVPGGFSPLPPDDEGGLTITIPTRADGRPCPCYPPQEIGLLPQWDHRPRFGGGFHAGRIRKGRRVEHRALDIMAAAGTVVRALTQGRIPEIADLGPTPRGRKLLPGAGQSIKGGWYVVLADEDGFDWYHAHMLRRPLVAPGDDVEAGQPLGLVGRTGNAVRTRRKNDGSVVGRYGCPHLHLRGKAPHGVTAVTGPGGELLDMSGGHFDVLPLLRLLYDAGDWSRP